VTSNPSPDSCYSEAFVGQVLRTMPEDWDDAAYLRVHLDGSGSRLATFRDEALPELEFHCGPLAGKRVLEYGCGMGSATVVLASTAREVVAFDINASSVEVCRARLSEHHLTNVALHHADDFSELAAAVGNFDVVVLHAVLEHVPRSIPGLRRRVIRQAFGAVQPGGFLFVFETPNRLWPRDIHTTGLWWIPWTPAGSAWAYRRAVANHVHRDRSDITPGPLGLEERGAWGVTYWELRNALPVGEFRIANLQPGHDRWVRYTKSLGAKRRVFETVAYWSLTRTLRIPVVAVAPMLSPLIVERVPASDR
jgi:2-polyprenyl-3-methyl-5-hydroxy-6-metoxy-1,4-benzoquinol methylase